MSFDLTIKPAPSGDKFTISVTDAKSMTVSDLKNVIQSKSNVTPEEQRLIYKGYVLKDARTLESYGVTANQTILMVRGKKTEDPQQQAALPAQPPQQTQRTSTQPPASAIQQPSAGTAGAPPNPFNMFSQQPGGSAFNPFSMDPSQMQAMLASNPEMMQSIMNSPIMQQMTENPEIMMAMMRANPQVR